MAFNFFPKELEELEKTLTKSKFSNDSIQDSVSLFLYLKQNYGDIETPICFDLNKKKTVKVTRYLEDEFRLSTLKRNANISTLNVSFGNGSSGNRGANNQGNLFEKQFVEALNLWWQNELSGVKRKYIDAIEKMDDVYKLKKLKKFDVKQEGEANTKRPLQFSNGIYLKNPSGFGYEIGSAVTDVTIYNENNPIYLSLKRGNQVDFFGTGVAKTLNQREIDNNQIKNREGRMILDVFGINEYEFCKIFTEKNYQGFVQKNVPYDNQKITKLLKSGIGYGYHMVHDFRSNTLSKQIDKNFMNKASRVKDMNIYYGGKGGNGKRVDITLSSDIYDFKITIRDKKGKKGYPSHLLCSYKYN